MNRSYLPLNAALALITLITSIHTATATAPPPPAKHRIVVMTDIGGDPDDRQSLVRFLLYACDFDVEGFCTGFGFGHDRNTRPDLIRAAVDAYGEALPNLRKHRADYPPHEALVALIKDGHNGDPHAVGPGMDSEASDWIIRVVDRDDPRPVWFSIWGGPRELAQAIWKVSQKRSPEELAAFKRKIRVHSIADQDRTAGWVKEHHPDVVWLYSRNLFRGIWKAGDQSLVSRQWLTRHVLNDHGPLAPHYPPKAAGKDAVKEGDTPSFFYVLPDGLSNPEHPEWGNWGGRFRLSGKGCEYLPADDLVNGKPDMLYTIHRWRRAYQNAFEARMDWCVAPFDRANHAPIAVCNGDTSRRVLRVYAEPGKSVSLSASGSSDPDGHALNYRWWIYEEAGSYEAAVPISDAHAARAALTVPRDAAGRSIHVILEVTDDGKPSLTAYRRVVIGVSGKPATPSAGTELAAQDPTEPVTSLAGPPDGTGPWTFYRGININGAAVEIDGNRWEGDNAAGFDCSNEMLVNTHVKLQPPTDAARARMIRSFRWDRKASAALTGVPEGTYAIYLYIWEETSPERVTILLNGKTVERSYNTGRAGQWRRLGPWTTQINDSRILLTATGGAANLSGIEVWQKQTQEPQRGGAAARRGRTTDPRR